MRENALPGNANLQIFNFDFPSQTRSDGGVKVRLIPEPTEIPIFFAERPFEAERRVSGARVGESFIPGVSVVALTRIAVDGVDITASAAAAG